MCTGAALDVVGLSAGKAGWTFGWGCACGLAGTEVLVGAEEGAEVAEVGKHSSKGGGSLLGAHLLLAPWMSPF